MALLGAHACALPAARAQRVLTQRRAAAAPHIALAPRALRCARVAARAVTGGRRHAVCSAAAAAAADGEDAAAVAAAPPAPEAEAAPTPAPSAPAPAAAADASVGGKLKGFFGGSAKLDKAKLAALGTSALLAYGALPHVLPHFASVAHLRAPHGRASVLPAA
jgi:hypothetical protein